jgi:Mg-chelatase subunit ChlD
MIQKLSLFILMAVLFSNCQKKKTTKATDNIRANSQEIKKETRNAEIVFCLDATGSMSGLIKTAKENIWDIVSDLSQDQEIDTLKLGMIFYRDRGDDFITKQLTLTTNLDGVYTDLLEIGADGGGDAPESVNQALNEAVQLMNWSTQDMTYKTIFVVGDCPPHMDYQDDVLYTESCKIAAQKGITINTIKLGNSCQEAIVHFKKMAECTNGEFLKLDQNATDYSIETPYDEEINSISRSVDQSKLFYGNSSERKLKESYNFEAITLYDKASKTSNSSRSKYKLSRKDKKSAYEDKEIIDDFKDGIIEVDEIAEAELPDPLKNKTKSEKKKILEQMSKKRDSSYAKLKVLLKKRDAYIRAEERKNNDTLSFSKEVIKIMKKQSKKEKQKKE